MHHSLTTRSQELLDNSDRTTAHIRRNQELLNILIRFQASNPRLSDSAIQELMFLTVSQIILMTTVRKPDSKKFIPRFTWFCSNIFWGRMSHL